MTAQEIINTIKTQRKPEQVIIKWWRKEEDFIDFDLVDRFVKTAKPDETIDGFDLIGMNDVWAELERFCGDRIAKTQKGGEELVEWLPPDKESVEDRQYMPYEPQTLLDILDVETGGDYVD
ncbi:MAG: hypothetical protein HYS23_15525 [Geobacter sp.]|nr:hypothetical protein [Geobacter sp.]